jgi:hypothetical protein
VKSVLIDTSKGWVAVIIGEELLLKVFNHRLEQRLGKTVHMRELRLSEKFSILRIFNELFSRGGVELYSLKSQNKSIWKELLDAFIRKGISVVYVDFEVEKELKKTMHPRYFRLLNIYPNKERVQCADILAYGDSHHNLVRNIWKDIRIIRGNY